MISIDYFVISIIFLSSLIGFIRGCFQEIFSLAIFVISAFIATHYYTNIEIYFVHIEQKLLKSSIAIFLLFISTFIFLKYINYIVSILLQNTEISKIDRILGIFFGMFKGILIVSIMILFSETFTNLPLYDKWGKSKIIPKISTCTTFILHQVKYITDFKIKKIL